ncbi:hypothetical protein KUH03_10070 [Sphingobacterium sp. E70]|uniref:hypothetical protein n=1 Tax=Sphingobacterium sp. E70 TaxID=2853439 RepID=UPI00211C161B|nr:hypothetical protein [Sphingobacterium sp. E70]ULT27083.1 hypothetical protein KUH03_10070 [Sphingobacterium sp. E70]
MAFELRRATKGEQLIKDAAGLKNLRLFKCRNLAETNAVAWDTATLKKSTTYCILMVLGLCLHQMKRQGFPP